MIFTKMLRGMSRGTTPRDPLGKSVAMMVRSRLKDKGGESEGKEDGLSPGLRLIWVITVTRKQTAASFPR